MALIGIVPVAKPSSPSCTTLSANRRRDAVGLDRQAAAEMEVDHQFAVALFLHGVDQAMLNMAWTEGCVATGLYT